MIRQKYTQVSNLLRRLKDNRLEDLCAVPFGRYLRYSSYTNQIHSELIYPLVDARVGNPHLVLSVGETTVHHVGNEKLPVWNAFAQTEFFLNLVITLQNSLTNLLVRLDKVKTS